MPVNLPQSKTKTQTKTKTKTALASNLEFRKFFLERFKASLDFCVAAGYDKFTIEEMFEEFSELLGHIGPDFMATYGKTLAFYGRNR